LNLLKRRIISVRRRHIILIWVVFVLRRSLLLLWVLHVLRLHVLVLISVHLWIIHLYWIFLRGHLIIHWLAWAIHLFVLFWNNIFISRLINLRWILGCIYLRSSFSIIWRNCQIFFKNCDVCKKWTRCIASWICPISKLF
jgi:hypothetical protein